MKPRFFATPADFKKWLDENHDKATEALIGFYKRGSGKPSITWPESVDEALCVGWIDGVRRSLGEVAYTIRFTPRRARSIWSVINVKRAQALIKEKRMRPSGLEAFEARSRTGVYSFEQRKESKLAPVEEKQFRANVRAWDWFQSQAPWYQRTAIFWVVSPKRPETRVKRFATLIDCSAHRRTIGPLTRPQAK